MHTNPNWMDIVDHYHYYVMPSPMGWAAYCLEFPEVSHFHPNHPALALLGIKTSILWTLKATMGQGPRPIENIVFVPTVAIA